jgi:hypothetical protein
MVQIFPMGGNYSASYLDKLLKDARQERVSILRLATFVPSPGLEAALL